MSRMVRRPAATRFHTEPQQGPLTTSQTATTAVRGPAGGGPMRDLARQSFGAVDQVKAYGGGSGGTADSLPFQYVWQDRVQVNPAREQPRLIFNSGAQPLIRWGLMRRFTRTFMSASPRFQGRWAYVGFIQRGYTERARMTGVATRQSVTYVVPRVGTGPGPRGIRLGSGAPL